MATLVDQRANWLIGNVDPLQLMGEYGIGKLLPGLYVAAVLLSMPYPGPTIRKKR